MNPLSIFFEITQDSENEIKNINNSIFVILFTHKLNIIFKNTSLNMVTKNDIKFLKNLKQKKFRDLNKCFVVEGKKSIK